MKRLGLHNIHNLAQSDLAGCKVGVSVPRGGTFLIAPSAPVVKRPLRVLRAVFPFLCLPTPEVCVCVAAASWWRAVARFWLQSWPRPARHAWELVTTPTGLALRCPRCRTQTPGWTLDAAPPTRRFAGARRPKVRIGWLTNTGTSRLRD